MLLTWDMEAIRPSFSSPRDWALAGQLCAMRDQRTAKFTLNSVFTFMKLIPLLTVSGQKKNFHKTHSLTSAAFVCCTNTVHIGTAFLFFCSLFTTRHLGVRFCFSHPFTVFSQSCNGNIT